jgi:predicted RNA-binding Zn-ribbon protein involved in translation (DUF1610 family)
MVRPIIDIMPKVAEELLAYCTKCRLDLMHVIVSMDGGAIVKTQCKSCGGVHIFRAPKGRENNPNREKVRRTRKGDTGSSRRKITPGTDPAGDFKQWMELMAARADKKPRDYRMQENFGEGELISHSVFGEGIVLTVPGPQKIEVHFEAGIKLLAQGR